MTSFEMFSLLADASESGRPEAEIDAIFEAAGEYNLARNSPARVHASWADPEDFC